MEESHVSPTPEVSEKPSRKRKKEGELSNYGKELIKALGEDPRTIKATVTAVKRFGMAQPNSIFNVVPPEVQQLLIEIPEEFVAMTEVQLAERVPITRVDRRVRIQLWSEFERSNAEMRRMQMGACVQDTGVLSWDFYFDYLKNNPATAAYVFTPPPTYAMQLREAESLGLERLTEILSLDIRDEKGRINPSVGLLILATWKAIDNRRYGAPTQKNVSVAINQDISTDTKATLDVEAIEAKLQELEKELNQGVSEKSVTIEVKSDR